jgi:AraC-like DNA-binding protein
MSETKLRLVDAIAREESKRPSARTAEVLAKLDELKALWSERAIDPRLARVAEIIQRDLSRQWSIDALARAVGMSRAVLARKFAEAFGDSPGKHLRDRRMERAAVLLLTTDEPLIAIAHAIGYRSEFAFGRAFKKHSGVAPGIYRAKRMHRAPVLRLAA